MRCCVAASNGWVRILLIMMCSVLYAVLCAVCRGERLKLKDLAAAMAAMDTDESGRIELEEFQQWWADNGESANQPYMYSTLLPPRANER